MADALENEFLISQVYRPPYLDVLSSQVDLDQITRVVAGGRNLFDGFESDGMVELRSSPELLSRLAMLVTYSERAIVQEEALLAQADSVIAMLRQEIDG